MLANNTTHRNASGGAPVLGAIWIYAQSTVDARHGKHRRHGNNLPVQEKQLTIEYNDCMRSSVFFRNRKSRRERMLRKLENMRAAKERKRLERPAQDYPPTGRYQHPLELGLRDTRSGEVAWVPFRSLRDSMRRLTVVAKYYQ